jgi:proteasome assembly chaperone (PAC2) family protein
MSSSGERGVATKGPLSMRRRPKGLSLVVGWSVDAARLGTRVIDYLNHRLTGENSGEIDPVEFFPLGGVSIADDVIQFPESRFYRYPGKGLLILRSDPPVDEWYRFLTQVLDTAATYGEIKEIYTIGGMVSLSAHTTPVELMATFNLPQFKNDLSRYAVNREMDYETPPGQRPTLSSFLLWAARARGIPGASLWVPVPFYLVPVGDPRAEKLVLNFLKERFTLDLDLGDADARIRRQGEMIGRLRQEYPDVNEAIQRLEANQQLPPDQSQGLVKEIERLLGEQGSG